MATALISDLHSNIEALTEVLNDARSQGCDKVYCLGDLVGYGPDPEAVVDKAMEFGVAIMGNHDEAVIKEAYGFNPIARAAVTWTRTKLKPGFFSSGRTKKRWQFLCSLKLTHEQDDMLFVHGSPRDPTMEYILRSDCFSVLGEVPEKIRDIFGRVKRLLFNGHTHDPGVITEDGVFHTPKELGGEVKLDPNRKYLINVGSVGQPRDGDVRACYAILDDAKVDYRRTDSGPGGGGGGTAGVPAPTGGGGQIVRWRRVEYEYRKTMEKIFAIPELDRRAGDRLALGR